MEFKFTCGIYFFTQRAKAKQKQKNSGWIIKNALRVNDVHFLLFICDVVYAIQAGS